MFLKRRRLQYCAIPLMECHRPNAAMTMPSLVRSLMLMAMLGLAGCSDSKLHPFARSDLEPLPVPAGKGADDPLPATVLVQRPTPVPARPQPKLDLAAEAPARATLPAPGPVRSDPNGVSLNFVDAELPSVVSSVLGDVLGLGYAIDPRVQGRVTLQTAAPVPRESVLATLEDVLRGYNVAMVRGSGGTIQVVPSEEARTGYGVAEAGRARGPGWRTQIVPVRYANAPDIARAMEGLTGPGTQVKAEAGSNSLIITGSGSEIANLLDTVAAFDVDQMRGQSFGLFRLQRATPRQVVEELEVVFQTNGQEEKKAGGPVRFLPIERMGAVVAIARRAETVRRIGDWIKELDRVADSNDPQLFVYKVESGRAAYLAEVLAKLYPEHTVDRVGRDRALQGDRPGGSAGQGQNQGFGTGSSSSSGADGGGFGGGAMSQSGGLGEQTSAAASAATPFGGAPSMGGANGGGAAAGGTAGRAGAGGPAAGAAADDRFDSGPTRRERSGSGVRIVADAASNALLIYARPAVYRQIEETLRRLDVVPAQVLIEATIAEVRLNDALSLGVQYYIESGNYRFLFSDRTAPSNATQASDAVSPRVPGFNFGFVTNNTQVILNALKSITDVKVLSTPTVLVLDNQTARLQVGEQVPIVTSQARSVENSLSPTVNSVELKDTGVILAVTPRITASGYVLMDVWQEVSDALQTTTSNIDSPSFQRRRLESSVGVNDRETIALGGLIRTQRQRDSSGIPELSEVPVLGWMFGARGDSVARTELLVLITPRVVRDAREARAMTDELRRRLSERPVQRPGVVP